MNMSGIRKDLREDHQSRPMLINLGGVHEVDGASKYSQGQTSVLVTVVGPVVPKFQRHELTETCKLEIEVNYASNIQNIHEDRSNDEELAIADFLRRAITPCLQLDQFPRKLILIQVLLLQNEGSVVSTALNATILALLNAGIPMLYCITCSEFAVLQDHVLLDPTSEEEANAIGTITICCKTTNQKLNDEDVDSTRMNEEMDEKITAIDFRGNASNGMLTNSIEIATKQSQSLSHLFRQAIADHLSTMVLY